MNHMRQIADRIFLVCFSLFLLAVCLITFHNRHETVSEYENRRLAAIPTLTQESFLDGSYFTGWDKFWSDRAAGRTTILKNHTLLQWKVLKKPVVNDVVITEHNLLPFYRYDAFDEYGDPAVRAPEVCEELSALQEHIQNNGGSFFYLGVPGQLTYFRETYPDYLENGDSFMPELHRIFAQTLEDADIPFINMIERFDAVGKPENFYYETDHHYAFDGAFYTYQCLMERINQETGLDLAVLTEEDLERTTLTQPFSGSRGRRLYNLFPTSDRLTYAVPKEAVPFTREDNGEAAAPSVLTLPKENEAASYTVYMGGDHGETIIRTNRPDLPKLLIFGDSYTNALESLMYTSFDEMRSLDLRHYQERTLWEYIADYQPDIVVYVRDETFFIRENPNSRFR